MLQHLVRLLLEMCWRTVARKESSGKMGMKCQPYITTITSGLPTIKALCSVTSSSALLGVAVELIQESAPLSRPPLLGWVFVNVTAAAGMTLSSNSCSAL
jgi:hypothetical protein